MCNKRSLTREHNHALSKQVSGLCLHIYFLLIYLVPKWHLFGRAAPLFPDNALTILISLRIVLTANIFFHWDRCSLTQMRSDSQGRLLTWQQATGLIVGRIEQSVTEAVPQGENPPLSTAPSEEWLWVPVSGTSLPCGLGSEGKGCPWAVPRSGGHLQTQH